jgi:hypothetical protein
MLFLFDHAHKRRDPAPIDQTYDHTGDCAMSSRLTQRPTCAVAVASTLAVLVSGNLGCSSSNSGSTQGGSGPGTGQSPYPAFTPSMPQLIKGGSLPVISAPVVVPVFFPGDAMQTSIVTGLTSWASSPAVHSLSEYGVRSVSLGTPVVLTETPAASLTGNAVQTWLEGKLDGTHAEFGPVDATTLASKVFAVFYPASTTVTYYGQSTCQFGGYNAGAALPSGAAVNYVVVPECSASPAGQSEADYLVGTVAGLTVVQTLSPDPDLQAYPSNFEYFEPAHAAFGFNTGFGACELDTNNFTGSGGTFGIVDVVAPNTALQSSQGGTRFWSNKAAAAYHDPCVPAPSGPYFVSVPVVSEPVQTTVPGMPPAGQPTDVMTTGVLVPVGTKKTIEIELLSDAPTSGPWTVSTQLAGPTGFSFSFDHTTGQNGDVLHLTIGAPSTPAKDIAAIYSTLGERRTFWVLAVQSK